MSAISVNWLTSEDRPARVEDAAVEAALLVREDAQAGEPARHLRGERLGVRRGHAEKDAEPRADLSERLPVPGDACLGYPLDDSSHGAGTMPDCG